MQVVKNTNEMLNQFSDFVAVSFIEFISSAFMRLIAFLVNLLLGL